MIFVLSLLIHILQKWSKITLNSLSFGTQPCQMINSLFDEFFNFFFFMSAVRMGINSSNSNKKGKGYFHLCRNFSLVYIIKY
jgi:hypothetical protein